MFFRLPSIILLDERATRLAPVVVWRKVPVFPKDMLPELLAMSNPHPTPRHPAYVRLDTYYSVAIVFVVVNLSKVGYDFLWGYPARDTIPSHRTHYPRNEVRHDRREPP